MNPIHPPPYPGPMASYPPTMAAPLFQPPYPGAYPGAYQQPVYPQHGDPAYGYGQRVYVMEEQRRTNSTMTGCLQGCLAALCCCCLFDMMTPCD